MGHGTRYYMADISLSFHSIPFPLERRMTGTGMPPMKKAT